MLGDRSYVLVSTNPEEKQILGGGYVWNGMSEWSPPEADGRDALELWHSGELRLTEEALADGYFFPPSPTPTEEEA